MRSAMVAVQRLAEVHRQATAASATSAEQFADNRSKADGKIIKLQVF
jgi:hypothetical protein